MASWGIGPDNYIFTMISGVAQWAAPSGSITGLHTKQTLIGGGGVTTPINIPAGSIHHVVYKSVINASDVIGFPDPSLISAEVYVTVKDSGFGAAATNFTITTSGGLIEGGASVLFNTDGQSYTFAHNGTDWFII